MRVVFESGSFTLLLSPVHITNNVEATLSNATSRTILLTRSNVASTKSNVGSTLLPFLATMSNDISFFRRSRNKLNTFNVFRFCRKDKISRKTRSTLLHGSKVNRAVYRYSGAAALHSCDMEHHMLTAVR